MLESVVLSLRSKALVEKNHAAIHEFQRLIARYQPEAAEGGGYLVVPETLTSEERLARETERNKVRKPPAELEMFEPSDEGEDRS